ncbi:hypothetical protein ACQ5SO_16415 [Rhodovulum sp. DZ06]|uniref:hypothetical protein n=1 Tax=Rhodovulum sp. DZ06 TaxID=3425126 RepID=UPI003D356F38
MFTFVSNPEFTHAVQVLVPVDDGHQEQVLQTRFRALRDDEAAAFGTSTSGGVREFLRAVVLGFEGVVDSGGAALASDAALIDRMLCTPFIRIALIRAYARALSATRMGEAA